MRLLIWLHFIICFTLFCTGLSAQSAALQVRIVDAQHRPQTGVLVELPAQQRGTYSDATGSARLDSLKPGTHEVVLKRFDLETIKRTATLTAGSVAELHVHMVPSAALNPIEVTERGDAAVCPSLNVQQISSVSFQQMRQVSLAEGLQFSPGLQIETNCQNCGYTQLRMNGLAGPYTQFLINGRPVFGEMAAIYALEQFPTQLIERVEVVRGGGSVVAGANAIAGTVNLITKRPGKDFFTLSSSLGVLPGGETDAVVTASTGIVTEEAKAGMVLFGQFRQREGYDRNNDNLTEAPRIGTRTLGLSAFWLPGDNTSIDLNAGMLLEDRRGGINDHQLAPHETEAAESIVGTSPFYDIRLQQTLGEWRLGVFGGGMHTRRSNYYGAGFDPNAYGYTAENNLTVGANIGRGFLDDQLQLLLGTEYRYHDVEDSYPGYDRYLAQRAQLAGAYTQMNYTVADWLTLNAGVRADYHSLLDQPAINPRAGVSGTFARNWSYRVNYAQGYRPPVAANEALHMQMVGGELRQVILADALEAEQSQSVTGGITRKVNWKGGGLQAKIDGFYTRLANTFVYEPLPGIADGMTFEMRNGAHSSVYGATLELEATHRWATLRSGWTYQQTQLSKPAVWSDMLEGAAAESDAYLRTPDWYGYATLTLQPTQALQITAEANFTGSMNAPHYGISTDEVLAYADEVPNSGYTTDQLLQGTLRTDAMTQTQVFAELGLHLDYTFTMKSGLALTLKAGGRNLLDSFQDDFDTSPLRDAGYIYGPHMPRMLYGGLSVSY